MSDRSQLPPADCPWLFSREEVTTTEEVLGTGVFCEVKVAVFRGLKVAAKSLRSGIISEHTLEIFTHQTAIASRLRHPNILLFIGATTQGHSPIILTELMATSLHAELCHHPLSKQQIRSIAMNVACGLNYLHQYKPHPIIHRDVSSPSVLLNPSGADSWEAKISDFGSAEFVHQISIDDVMPGSTAYAAPEAMFPKDHTPKMDVYSFGVLLFEMCLQQQPDFSTAKRTRQAKQVQWNSMARIIEDCMAILHTNRPTLVLIIEELRLLKVCVRAATAYSF